MNGLQMQTDDSRFAIKFEERDSYLYAFISGNEDTLEISKAYWQGVIAECHQRGFQKLLVEEAFPNQPSVAEMYHLIVEIREMVTEPLRIAFVDRLTEQNELNMFGETVAVNRGLMGRVFPSKTEAEAWLVS